MELDGEEEAAKQQAKFQDLHPKKECDTHEIKILTSSKAKYI